MAIDIGRNKNNLINIAVVLLAFVIAFNIYKSQSRSLSLLRQNIEDEKRKNSVSEEVILLKKEVLNYNNFFKQNDLSKIINIIAGIAKETNVQILSMKPEESVKAEQDLYYEYRFDVKLSCKSFHDLGRFVNRLEDMPDDIYFSISGLGISSPFAGGVVSQTQADLGLEVDLSLRIYYVKI
ncbi:MAG: hypothetical protein C4533_07025 [Candidatus Omnitrophota bacterium]|jgi:hypothetical protein|nr:MAG: hypothetical protein C4533_07025 [Candidatus Omnitrophota bacterium]